MPRWPDKKEVTKNTVDEKKTGSVAMPEAIKTVGEDPNPKKAWVPTKPIKPIEPLGPGQKYFEAPDGNVMIGEENADKLWYRVGKCWINPKR